MISFSSQGASELDFSSSSFDVLDLLKKIDQKKQGFYTDEVLDTHELFTSIQDFVRGHSDKHYLVVLGIGGSALGGIALQELLAKNTKKNIFFLDTLDPEKIEEVSQKIQLSSTLFLVMSKSGGTVETLSQYAFFLDKLQQQNFSISNHFCFVTGQSGFLREEAEKKNIVCFDVPENVGGRFSVLTPIGLIPACFMGINIVELMEGARAMKKQFFTLLPEKNLPFQFAAVQYNALKKNITKNVMYSYSNRLFSMADWFRQLLAESTGKKLSQSGEEVFTGITPINALGVTDHHSQNQLYMEGPFDTLICFLELQQFDSDFPVPHLGYTQNPLSFLQGKNFSDILFAEREAAKQSLSACNRPWVSISLSQMNAKNIGALFLFFEASTAFLCEMMNINAFDQPGVEQTKVLTKQILQAG
jgi:glucose-6-phosphate isomerase